MSLTSLTVTEAVRHFSDYIGRVTYRHESFILHKGKKAVAELRPLPTGRRLGELPDMIQSLPKLTKQEADDFIRDIETARAELNSNHLKDPWAS